MDHLCISCHDYYEYPMCSGRHPVFGIDRSTNKADFEKIVECDAYKFNEKIKQIVTQQALAGDVKP